MPVSYRLADLYYRAFPNDRTWTKIVVYTAYILETVHAIGLGIMLLLIIVGGDPYAGTFTYYWTSIDYKWATQALLIDLIGGMVPLIAQCVYAHRIRIITQRKAMPMLITALAILQLIAAIAVAIIPEMVLLMLWFWTGINVANDLIIAFIMVRSESLSYHTKSKVIRLVHLIIATGSLTVAANFLSFVLLLFSTYMTSTWISMAILIFVPKLYTNSMLVMLNNRMTIGDPTANMISINALSTLVIDDHHIGPSDPCNETIPTTSSTRALI
ncbi:hypothetical protein JOM56_006864 [Amanita muscaria]